MKKSEIKNILNQQWDIRRKKLQDRAALNSERVKRWKLREKVLTQLREALSQERITPEEFQEVVDHLEKIKRQKHYIVWPSLDSFNRPGKLRKN